MKNGCEKCLVYLIRYGKTEADLCLKCGKTALYWKQDSFGTFYMECANCGSIVAVDLNSPCELDESFQRKIKIEIKPQESIIDKEVVHKLGKLLQLNSLMMYKKLNEGCVVEIEHSEFGKLTKLMWENDIAFVIAQEENMTEQYFFYKDCNYPYSAMRVYLNKD